MQLEESIIIGNSLDGPAVLGGRNTLTSDQGVDAGFGTDEEAASSPFVADDGADSATADAGATVGAAVSASATLGSFWTSCGSVLADMAL